MQEPALRAWLGRSEQVLDEATPGPVRRLAALLDHGKPPWPDGEPPPLAHWLYFQPEALQSEIDGDGHPRRGGLLPPVDLPRRMWAGSRVTFHRPLPRHGLLRRRSQVADIQWKTGASGRMVLVTLRHEVVSEDALLVTEAQDIVFREPAATTPGLAQSRRDEPPATAPSVRRHTADETELFRFSALTFNAHRIHYDRDYARDVEGYPDLVVHGPYLATLLLDHFLRARRTRRVRAFRFRAQAPVFAGEPFDLCRSDNDQGATLWVRDVRGAVAMRAEVDAA